MNRIFSPRFARVLPSQLRAPYRAMSSAPTQTASTALLESLSRLNVSYVFANLGSDHPSLLEAMATSKTPKIITCPNEMVAMSMADGYARATNEAQAVLVHVDVGTQGLGAAVHNASAGRAPVLLLAGLSPVTQDGEMRGSRTEFIHWLQDVPDQKAIVAQYCRYAGEIKTGRNIKQMTARALQMAQSAPQGPAYLCASREVLEEDVPVRDVNPAHWTPAQLGGIPETAAEEIATALKGAKKPLLITSYAGRNHAAVPALVDLANSIPALRVLDAGGSDVNFPSDHPSFAGLRFGSGAEVADADVILVVDSDVPWIPTQVKPMDSARIFHIDLDPLKRNMPLFYIPAEASYAADSLASIKQIQTYLPKPTPHTPTKAPKPTTPMARLAEGLKAACPKDTIYAIEAVTMTVALHDQLRPTLPGSWINCAGGGLGWSGGGALGLKLATNKFVVQVVGDGSFLFSVPSSVYWISRRYNLPILTIVIDNKGWNAPRRSLLLVHPEGAASKKSNADLNLSFDQPPSYMGIAEAAGGAWGERVEQDGDMEAALARAVKVVEGGRSAVLEVVV